MALSGHFNLGRGCLLSGKAEMPIRYGAAVFIVGILVGI
jgi:hypothetical protein